MEVFDNIFLIKLKIFWVGGKGETNEFLVLALGFLTTELD